MKTHRLLPTLACILWCLTANAADSRLAMLPADAVTQHKITVRGQTLGYTATAGTLPLRDEHGEQTASVFYTAYTLAGSDPARRPVTFFFNGGPGAASAFLHLGAAGPVALNFPADQADGAHAVLADNPDTWLRFTDMVFIDQVGAGYSLAAKPEEAPRRFWGVAQDAQALAKVVATWIDRNGRNRSPKYLAAESYGGIRSVKVARALEEDQYVILDGIVMVSPLLEEKYFFTDDPMTYAFLLPTLAAAALERRHALSDQAVEDAYRYATGPYLATIVGPPVDGDAARDFYGKVASLTGVPEAVVAKERGLLQADAHDVRSMDGRLYSLYEMSLSIADPAPEGVDNDESPDALLEGFGHAYGNAFAGYAAGQLGFKTDLTYRLLDGEVNDKWDWREGKQRTATTSSDLKKLLALNPALHVLIVHGYFDTVCPFATSRWLAEHLPVGRDRVTVKAYAGGHMLYTRPAARAALALDVETMVKGNSSAQGLSGAQPHPAP